jgi:hypothetical protein
LEDNTKVVQEEDGHNNSFSLETGHRSIIESEYLTSKRNNNGFLNVELHVISETTSDRLSIPLFDKFHIIGK